MRVARLRSRLLFSGKTPIPGGGGGQIKVSEGVGGTFGRLTLFDTTTVGGDLAQTPTPPPQGQKR